MYTLSHCDAKDLWGEPEQRWAVLLLCRCACSEIEVRTFHAAQGARICMYRALRNAISLTIEGIHRYLFQGSYQLALS